MSGLGIGQCFPNDYVRSRGAVFPRRLVQELAPQAPRRGLGYEPLVGLGQSIGPLPQPGDVNGQIAYGNNLQALCESAGAAIQGGAPDAALMETLRGLGIPMSTVITTPSQLGNVERAVVTAVAAGAAIATAVGTTIAGGSCAGPWGAAIGAVVAGIEALVMVLTGPTGEHIDFNFGEPTDGAKELFELVHQWGQMTMNVGGRSDTPCGMTFYDYIVHKYPPSTVGQDEVQNMWNQVVNNLWAAQNANSGTLNGVGNLGISKGIHNPNQNNAFQFAEAYFIYNYNNWGPCNSQGGGPTGSCSSQGECYQPYQCVVWSGGQASTQTLSDQDAYKALAQPLASSVLWNWALPESILNVENNQFYQNTEVRGIPNYTTEDYYNIWYNDTVPILSQYGSYTRDQIVAYAEANRPSPMFYASDLYVAQQQAGSAGSNQLFGNCATMSGVATVFGLLAAGGSVQSVISELLIQQAVLATPLGPSAVPQLFRLLVEEYLAKAIAEQGTTVATPVSQLPKAAPPATVSTGGGYGSAAHPLITLAVPGGQAVTAPSAAAVAPTTTTTPSLGTALLVGGVIAVAGFLGYSAYIKQSPIDVIKSL
jgi:hypothetical protein